MMDDSNFTVDDSNYTDDDAANFTYPADMRFGEANVYSIILYSILLVVGLVANSMSLFQLIR